MKSGIESNRSTLLPYWLTATLILVCASWVLVQRTYLFIPAFALATMLSAGFLIRILGFRLGFLLLLFTLPLARNIEIAPGTELMFPSEWIVTAIAVAVLLEGITVPGNFKPLMRHPVTWMFLVYLTASGISIAFSDMVSVSVKSVIIKVIYALAFYAGGFAWFREQPPGVRLFNVYAAVFVPVVCWVIVRHAGFNFEKEAAGYVTKPFFNDHTIYSAVIVFLLPFMWVQTRARNHPAWWLYGAASVLFVGALAFASSRAAWLSFGVMLLFALLFRLGITWKLLMGIGLLAGALFWYNFESINDQVLSNRFDSNARNAGLNEQTKSVANVTNDQSNAERINRWKCAVRMFEMKPLTGFGAGTYQFAYLPFQRDYEMTRISVKTPYNIPEGRGGTAHNEYLLALSESGLAAALGLFLVFVLAIRAAFRIAAARDARRPFAVAAGLALISFSVHALFNNFLDTDKAAALVYITLAALVYLELRPAERP